MTLADPAFDPMAFKHFKVSGDEQFCMVHYSEKRIECKYVTYNDCRNDYRDNHVSICFARKNLKLEVDKKK